MKIKSKRGLCGRGGKGLGKKLEEIKSLFVYSIQAIESFILFRSLQMEKGIPEKGHVHQLLKRMM